MTYRVSMHYPRCVEEMVFRLPGLEPTENSEIEVRARELEGVRYPNISGPIGEFYRWTYQNDQLIISGASWDLRSRIEESAFGNPTEYWLYIGLGPEIPGYTTPLTPFVRRPPTDNVVALANACLALVRQEKADREHAAAVAQAEADAAARRQAELDAELKRREQAKRDAEAQARVAEAELASARESQRIVAETELIRTQTLKAQLAHEEAIAGILQEIARIRFAGQQDRARLTNEYLVRAEASAEAFNVEVEEIEATIQRYLDFNAELLAQLEAYRADIATKLREAERDLAEQQARIEALGRIEETPEPGDAN